MLGNANFTKSDKKFFSFFNTRDQLYILRNHQLLCCDYLFLCLEPFHTFIVAMLVTFFVVFILESNIIVFLISFCLASAAASSQSLDEGKLLFKKNIPVFFVKP